MKVKELIEMLQGYNPDIDVLIYTPMDLEGGSNEPLTPGNFSVLTIDVPERKGFGSVSAYLDTKTGKTVVTEQKDPYTVPAHKVTKLVIDL